MAGRTGVVERHAHEVGRRVGLAAHSAPPAISSASGTSPIATRAVVSPVARSMRTSPSSTFATHMPFGSPISQSANGSAGIVVAPSVEMSTSAPSVAGGVPDASGSGGAEVGTTGPVVHPATSGVASMTSAAKRSAPGRASTRSGYSGPSRTRQAERCAKALS